MRRVHTHTRRCTDTETLKHMKSRQKLKFRLWGAGLGESRQVGGDSSAAQQNLKFRLWGAGLGKSRHI